MQVAIVEGGSQTNLEMGAYGVDTAFELTFAFDDNDAAASLNGGAPVTSAARAFPASAPDTEYFGSLFTSQYWNSTIAFVRRYNDRKSNAWLQNPAAP